MHDFITSLLETDVVLLQWARTLLDERYAFLIQFVGEIVVIWMALFLVALWLRGTFSQDDTLKKQSLGIAVSIFSVYIVYCVYMLVVPQFRPNPQLVVGGIAPLIPHVLDNSFPSGHALFFGASLIGIWKWYRRPLILIITFFLGIATVCARVIAGVHYPGDILGGFIFGFFGSLLLFPFSSWISLKITPFCLTLARYLRL